MEKSIRNKKNTVKEKKGAKARGPRESSGENGTFQVWTLRIPLHPHLPLFQTVK